MPERKKFESPQQRLEHQALALRNKVQDLILANKTEPGSTRFRMLMIERKALTDEQLKDALLAQDPELCDEDPTLCQTLVTEFDERQLIGGSD